MSIIQKIPTGATAESPRDAENRSASYAHQDPGDRVPQMARMPWYPRDFASATRGWPLVARGTYRELLDSQWDMGSLPSDPVDLQMIAGASEAEWGIAWRRIEPKFPVGDDGLRRNRRLEQHRRDAIRILQRQRAGGIAGNNKRWKRQK